MSVAAYCVLAAAIVLASALQASIGGPPMALVWQRRSGAQLRGTMSGFFLVGSVLSLVMLTLTGAIGARTLWGCAVLIPAALTGFLLSTVLNRHLNPKRLRWLAIAVSTAGALMLAGRSLLM